MLALDLGGRLQISKPPTPISLARVSAMKSPGREAKECALRVRELLVPESMGLLPASGLPSNSS
jgi:hypothetical protein